MTFLLNIFFKKLCILPKFAVILKILNFPEKHSFNFYHEISPLPPCEAGCSNIMYLNIYIQYNEEPRIL